MSVKPKDQFAKLKRATKRSELEALVKNLVRIQSHSEVPTREKEVAHFLNEFLVSEGISSKLRIVDKDRPNVIAVVEGSGGGKSLMLNGHTDTVPAYDMSIEPFKPKIAKGRLYGRGALDMKGGLGSMAMTLVAMRRARIKLQGDLFLTAVVGEEQKSEGTEDIVTRGPKADAAIVGEPTDLEIQPTHRGLEWLNIHFYGKAAHGGQAERGANAISMAGKFINAVEEDLLPRLRVRKSRYTLPSTLNLGVIQGGQQPSSVADHCLIRIDRRWIPEENLQHVFTEIYEVFDKIKKEDPEFKAELKRDPSNIKTMTHVPNVVSINHPVVKSLERSVRLVTGKPPKVTSFWGWTDAALLTHFAKIPSVVFGPGGAGAHAKIEYVLTDDLLRCVHVYSMAALDICSASQKR